MPTARLLPRIIALALAIAGGATSVVAQTPRPGPAKAPSETAKAPPSAEMAFYVAHGDADACGHGCSEWIAAEGKIDAGAPQRLRRLLAKLGRRKPIIFFHSPGGQIIGSIELGRLLREQKLTVSVGRTIPRGCDRNKLSDKACEALKRSGQELAADLDPSALCASACVYTLAGGASRLVPPWVKVGIHDIGFDPDKKLPRGAPLAEVKRILRDKLQSYLRDMGFDRSLLTAASAVPNESMRFVERDEIIRFGLDRREFGETAWSFAAKPPALVMKGFFARSFDGTTPPYRDGIVSLTCTRGRGIGLALGRQRAPAEHRPDDPLTVRIDVNGQEIELGHQTISDEFDIQLAIVPVGKFDALGDDDPITLTAIAGSGEGAARTVTLSMDGFSAAYARLRRNCDEPALDAAVSPGAKAAAPLPGTTPAPALPVEP